MSAQIIYFIEKIYNTNSLEEVYLELIDYFEQKFFIIGVVNVLEQVWRLNNDRNLLIKIGDLYCNIIGDYASALSYFNKYYQTATIEEAEIFIEKFKTNYNVKLENIPVTPLEDNSENYIIYSKFAVLSILLYYAFTIKEYKTVLYIDNYLEKIEAEILHSNQQTKAAELSYIKDDKLQLANVLVEVDDIEEMNLLAIKYNPNLEIAYINILANLINKKLYDKALNYYNKIYAVYFQKEKKVDKIWELGHILSEFYHLYKDFYKTTFFLKFALEQELGE